MASRFFPYMILLDLCALISFDSKDTVENYQYSSFGEVDSTQKSLSPWGFPVNESIQKQDLSYLDKDIMIL